ncbi:MAG TPA: leukotoxin LktA family filamentous adhesin [Burkholderiales bacterium]|nr:leukotoxin LktA family filamentous adhesin [Burkholderiales bacterium]
MKVSFASRRRKAAAGSRASARSGNFPWRGTFRRFSLTPLAVALGTAMGFPSISQGDQIVTDGRTRTTLNINGRVTDVSTATIVGNNAFNSFSKFDVYSGNTVNLQVPAGASNLLNLVSSASASRIDGMLNAVKNGQIGGNVFLANPEGIIVGSGGVINAGSLTLLTPTHAFIDNFFDAPGAPNAAATTSLLTGTVPINDKGLILIKGRINTAGDATLQGGDIINSGAILTGAVFRGAQADFSDIVNVNDVTTGNRIAVQNGKIRILAANDIENSGTLSADGAGGLNANDIEIRAGHDVNLVQGGLVSASGHGERSSGGNVVIWAENQLTTGAGSAVRADGGEISGDGGFIDLSARKTLVLSGGALSATAPHGVAGSILLDPENLVIDNDLLRGDAGANSVSAGSDGIVWDAGNLTLTADDTITVNANRVISTRQVTANSGQSARDAHISNDSTGDSGDLTLNARAIVLDSGAQLLANSTGSYRAGNITIAATDSATDLFFKALDGQDAGIDIHGATLKGGKITLTATADDVFHYTGSEVANVFLKQLDDIAYLVDISISQAKAHITIDGNAALVAKTDVDIESTAKTLASMNVTGESGFGVGYGKAAASATTQVTSASITAGGTVKVAADSTAATDITVETINRGRTNSLTFDASKYIDVALAMSEANLDSTATIGSASTVNAGGALSVAATGHKSASVSANGGAYDDGTAGAGVALSSFTSNVTAHLDGSVTNAGSVTVSADLTSLDGSNSISASSGSGSGLLTTAKQFLPSQIVTSALSVVQAGILDALTSKPQSPASSQKFGLAAAFLYLDQQNNVEARIGPAASVKSIGAVDVEATSSDILTYRAAASVDQAKLGDGSSQSTSVKKVALSAAIAVADLDNETRAYIGDGAVVDSGGAITVNAHSDFPVPYSAWGNWSDVTDAKSGMDKIDNLLGSATLSTITGWTQSFAESDKLGLSGSFNFFGLNNSSEAWIGDGVRINTGHDAGGIGNAQDVSVTALSTQGTINLAGVFGFKLAGVNAQATGIGGGLASLDFGDTAHASIGSGSIINAHDLVVDARSDTNNITIAESGGKSAKGTSFNASIALVDVDNSTTATIDNSAVIATTGALDIHATDDTKNVVVAGGFSKGINGIGIGVVVTNVDRATFAGIADTAAALAATISLDGLSADAQGKFTLPAGTTPVAGEALVYHKGATANGEIGNLDDGTVYYVIVPDPTHPNVIQLATSANNAVKGIAVTGLSAGTGSGHALAGTGTVSAQGTVDVNATSGGMVTSLAVAGSLVTDGQEPAPVKGESASARMDKLADYQNKAEANKGLGFSGSASVTSMNDATEASLTGARVDHAASLSAEASNSSSILSVSGSVAVSTARGKVPGIAGAYSENDTANVTRAFVHDSMIDVDGALGVSADTEGSKMEAITAGVAVATKYTAVAGAVSINGIENQTLAWVDGGSSIRSGSASINASDEASIFTLAGSLDYAGKQGFGVGASVSINDIANTTDAHVAQSDLEATAGGVSVTQSAHQDIEAVAVSAGASTGGLAANFAVSANMIESTDTAYVSGKLANGVQASGAVAVSASDDSSILAIGGGLALSTNSGGVGASGAYSSIDNDVSAYLLNAKVVSTGGNVIVTATTDDDIETIGIGFAGGQSVGLAGSVAVNRIDTTTAAYLSAADVSSYGSIAVTSIADYDFTIYAGALGIGLKTAGFGGTVAVNLLYGDTRADITGGSLVDAKGFNLVTVPTLGTTGAGTRLARGVAVLASTSQDAETWGISGGLSANVGIGLTGAGNEASGSTLAYIDGGSKVNTRDQSNSSATQDVSVEAFSTVAYSSDLGGLGVGLSTAGVGATVGIGLIDTTTKAYIDGAEADARNALKVATFSTESVEGVGIAAAGGSDAALAGTVFVTKIGGTNEAYIINANSIDVGGDLVVHAEDHVYIGRDGSSGMLGGAAAVSFGASGGAAVSAVTIENATRAYISNAQTDAMGATRVQAVSSQEANSGVMGIAISQWFGAAASVVVNNIATTTEAYISEPTGGTTKINAGTTNANAGQQIEVSASNKTTIDTQIFGAGGAFVGVGAGVDATSIRNTVNASIGANTEVHAIGDVAVTATSNRDVTSGVIAFGGGVVGVAGAVTVLSIGATMSASDVANTQSTVDGQTTKTFDLMGMPGDSSGLSVGSMFGSTVIPGGTSASIGNSASVTTTSGDITVQAADTIKVHAIDGGGTAGLGGAGASVGLVTLNPYVQAFVGQGATLSTNGSITVHADATITDSSMDAYIGAIGGITLVQAVAKIDSNATVEAYIGNSVKVTHAAAVEVGATRSNEQEANAYGVSAAATGAYGGSVAQSTSGGTTSALVNDDADLANAGALSVTASNSFGGDHGNATLAVAAAGGGLVGGSGALAISQSSGDVIAATGDRVKLPDGDVIIAAGRSSNQYAETMGVTAGGALAVGVTISHADSSGTTHAELGSDTKTTTSRAGGLLIAAVATDSNDAHSTAGSGGVFAGNGSESDTSDDSHVFAGVGASSSASVPAIHSGAVTLQALHTSNYGGEANSVNAAAVGASGAFVNHDVSADAKVEIGSNVDIVAGQGIVARAHNEFISTTTGDSASAAAGGVLTGSAAESSASINSTTEVALDTGVKLDSGTDPILHPGGIVLEASTLVAASDHITLNTGGAIAGAGTNSGIEATIANKVDIGEGSLLTSTGNIAVGTFTQASLNAVSLVNTWGLAGIGVALAHTTADVKEDVIIGEGTTLRGFGNVNVMAGDDATGVLDASIAANASGDSYVRALLALPYATVNSDVTSHAKLEIDANAKILSAQNVTVGAYNGDITATAHGAGHGYQLGFIPTDTGNIGNSSPQPVTTAEVAVGQGAQVEAGIYHTMQITITDANCPPGSATCNYDVNDGAAPFTLTHDTSFDVPAFIDDHFSGTGALLIKSGTSSDDVGAVTLGTLFAAGGTVTVHADTLSGSGTITAHSSPTITVDNQSSNYLVLGNVLIPNTPGGGIAFTGTALRENAGSITLHSEDNGAGTITIHNSHAGPVGNSQYGPSIFLTKDIQNIGGTVNITNDAGSLGQAATIFGKTVNVKIPEGVAVIEVPDPGAYFSGGNPYSEWDAQMGWPGGNPSDPLLALIGGPNANLAFTTLFTPTAHDGGDPHAVVVNGVLQKHYFIHGDCTGGLCSVIDVNPQVSTGPVSYNYASGDYSGSAASSAIYGGKVLIKAKYIDIDGGISIGASTDWSIVLPASLTAQGGAIYQAEQAYLSSGSTAASVIPLDGLKMANGDSVIGAKYDLLNHRILLDDVRASSDGGSLVLDGGIISTNQLGNIHVNGGLGNVRIDNETGRAVVLQDIYAGNAGPTQTIVSSVDINDHFLDSATRHWVYQYTPQSGVSVYNGAEGSTVENGNMTLMPASSSYTPVQGLRWAWQEVAKLHNALPAVTGGGDALDAWGNILNCCNWSWEMPAGQANNPWQFVTASGGFSIAPQGAVPTLPNGDPNLQPGGPAFTRTITGQLTDFYNFTSNPSGSQNFWWRNADPTWTGPSLFFPKEATLTISASVRADYPIAINFTGSSVGNVDIRSNAAVSMLGTITNPGGATSINAGGAITQATNAAIQTDSLVISATAGIGANQQPVFARMSADGTVTALGGTDGVYLDLQGGRIASVVSKNTAGTQFGNVWVRALDDLLPVAGGSGAIVGSNVTLTSTLGNIGSQATPVRVSAMGPDGASGKVDATAQRNIWLTDTATHDFLVGRIASVADGDISISVPHGSILNESGQTTSDTLGQDQVRQVWQDLHLTQQYGAEEEGSRTARSVIAFENLANRYYQDYFALVHAGDTSSARYQTTVAWLNENVGGGWQTAQPDPNFSYHATDAQVADLTKNAVWTEAELSNSIKQAALKSNSGAPVGIGDPNIVGHNVTLVAGTGVGKLADPIDISLDSIVAGTLSTKQSAAMTLAKAPGDIQSLGKDAQGNFVTYELATLPDGSVDYASVPAGITPYGFRIAQTAPVFVEMTGALNATAGDAAFVQSVRPTLVVDRVQAGGAVGLIAPASIVAAATRTNPNLPLISAGGDLRLTVGTGSLGTALAPLTLEVGGKLVSASAAQNAYLTSSGNLTVDSIFAGGQLVLEADDGGVFAGSSGVVINAHGVNIHADGDIGSSQNALTMQVADTDSFSGSAGGSANVHGAGASFNVASLTAGTDAQLSADGNLFVGQVQAGGAANVTAHAAVLAAAGFSGVNVTAEGITLNSDTADVGAATKRFVIEDHGTTNASAFGNLYLEQRNTSLKADALTALNGSLDLLVAGGDATIGKITALDAVSVALTTGGKLLIDDLDPASANLAVAGAGGEIEVTQAQVSQSLSASASSVKLDSVTQTGGSGPLHMTLQGAGGGMAGTVDANIVFANGVTIDRLSAQDAQINASVANLWIESASIGGTGVFTNQSFTAWLDNAGRVHHDDADLQLYAPFPFYLRFFADPRFETNALAIDYKDNISVNGVGPENSVTHFIPRLLSMLGIRSDKQAQNETTPEDGLVTWSSESLIPEDAIISIEQLEVNGR